MSLSNSNRIQNNNNNNTITVTTTPTLITVIPVITITDTSTTITTIDTTTTTADTTTNANTNSNTTTITIDTTTTIADTTTNTNTNANTNTIDTTTTTAYITTTNTTTNTTDTTDTTITTDTTATITTTNTASDTAKDQEELDAELLRVSQAPEGDVKEAVVRALLAEGANPNVKAIASGLTPLHYAAQNNNKVLAQLLADYGADLNALDNYNGVPLHDAALFSPVLTHFLIEKGANLNVKTIYSRTPLHIAAWNGKEEMVSLLVQHGSTLDGIDQLGETALDKYISRGINIANGSSTNNGGSNGSSGTNGSNSNQYIDKIIPCIVFHGASWCLEKNFNLIMKVIRQTKMNFIQQWPLSWLKIPESWRKAIIELIVVITKERAEWGIPKDLKRLLIFDVIYHWPLMLEPHKNE